MEKSYANQQKLQEQSQLNKRTNEQMNTFTDSQRCMRRKTLPKNDAAKPASKNWVALIRSKHKTTSSNQQLSVMTNHNAHNRTHATFASKLSPLRTFFPPSQCSYMIAIALTFYHVCAAMRNFAWLMPADRWRNRWAHWIKSRLCDEWGETQVEMSTRNAEHHLTCVILESSRLWEAKVPKGKTFYGRNYQGTN